MYRRAIAVIAFLFAKGAWAHGFTQPYALPIPFWMYAWGSAAALALSFVIVGIFARAPALSENSTAQRQQRVWYVHDAVVQGARVASLAALVLCIVTGLFGTQRPLDNLSMTLFWIVFVLLLPYTCAIVGNFFSIVNPWLSLVNYVEVWRGRDFQGCYPSTAKLGYVPALVFYMVFIWLELFGELSPRGLGLALLGYTACTLVGAWLFGTSLWFRYGEIFSVFFRLISLMAPLSWETGISRSSPTRVRLRSPFSCALEERPKGMSLVVFVLFMLSSTAYDGIHSTLPWMKAYWNGIYPHIAPFLSDTSQGQLSAGTKFFQGWQWLVLLVSPFLYLVLFRFFVELVKIGARSTKSGAELTALFSISLVPIALVYHVTHYYTLLVAQLGQLARLISDPFGWGWNVFGTSIGKVPPLMLEMASIWHTQVALILGGHIASVYVAHLVAMQVFKTPRKAVISQLPMLVLMALFTAMGLWILSLPLAPGA